ncbi:MAG: helix-hairpin-helix domain-containing protein [Deltaproteobacteria bacterium]|nr:helix-hairpin-helix domain-containing protein [Deltaproteobacteria bacterium]
METRTRFFLLAVVVVVVVAFAPALWADDSQKVNINIATVEELMKLKNVGRTYAERIVQYREENGPFKAPEDITRVKGIGAKTYEINKEIIVTE